MGQALELATQAIGRTEPNPRVGCVIGTAQGLLLGQGATQQAGQAHAEVMALRNAQAAGASVVGATAWVTLEPCSHHGRTPPCCDALIAAGVARVVVAVVDPFPQIAGEGIARLRAAGIVVDTVPADLVAAAWELNIGFFSRVIRHRPWVRLKIAASLDGMTALPNGQSQWITSEAARADGRRWRSRASAILTGVGTVLADDPLLNVRHGEAADIVAGWQPLRLVVDSHFRTPPTARILANPGQCIVMGCATDAAAEHRRLALAHAGALALRVSADTNGRVELPAIWKWLNDHDTNELHIEAGAALSGSVLAQGFADELLIYRAPTVLGPGRGMADTAELNTLSEAPRFRWADVQVVGSDLRTRLVRVEQDSFSPRNFPTSATSVSCPPLE